MSSDKENKKNDGIEEKEKSESGAWEVPAEHAAEERQPEIPAELPVIPMSELIIFPMTVIPLIIDRPDAVAAMDAALARERIVLLLVQKNRDAEETEEPQLFSVGTAAAVIRMLKMPDGRTRVILQGLARARAAEMVQRKPFTLARVTSLSDEPMRAGKTEVVAWMRSMRKSMEQALSLGKSISPEILMFASGVDEPGRLADLAAATLDISLEESQKIIEELNPLRRLRTVHELYGSEIKVLMVQQRISNQAKDEMDRTQREYILRQQLRAIQQELGEGGELAGDIEEYRAKIKRAKMPAAAASEAEKQLKKLERMSAEAAEAAVIRNYLDVIVDLPWAKSTQDRLDLAQAKKILDEDHYDLVRIKDRILEHLGVMKLKRGKMRGPILCFVGPPGVGKTSLGQSIARALNRKFVRLSLGGVRDEAEVRGHRRTYVGALPGRIIQGISQAATNNPVFMMDEVDKIGADFRGDPSSALLEVLDPEQNCTFRDNYLGVDFDLSRVMFILTANQLDTIQPAFRDRMEILFLSGYTLEEKLKIAERYLVPRQRRAGGITANQLQITEAALGAIVSQYTLEAGVRNLEREIASICRKVARKVAEGKRGRIVVQPEDLGEFLGPPKHLPEEMLKRDQVGVATGVAWTPVGGDVIFIEAIVMRGGGGLTLTGQLGDVMKESAKAALSYTKANAEKLDLAGYDFAKRDVHIHVPEGAIPKDGPSAGVTMATALVSAFTGFPVRKDIAMTGEITLRGTVLPVGGIREKVLAARRMGIKSIILPKLNEKDLVEIQEELRRNLHFHFVDQVGEVLELALQRGKSKKPRAKASAANARSSR